MAPSTSFIYYGGFTADDKSDPKRCESGACSIGRHGRRARRRRLGSSNLDSPGGRYLAVTTAATSAFLISVLLFLMAMIPVAAAGRCAFTQECFQNGVDTDCIPAPASDDDSLSSFPMDNAHGFGVTHDKVWDGSVEDPSTGLCASGGTPDGQGRCMVDFVAPKGLSPVAPVICPQYEDDGCCTWQQNYALYQNLRTLVDSFGSATGCLACAVNLVNFWCALICSPDQGSFVSVHDPPFAQRMDDLTGGSGRVLQSDVSVDGDLACRIYDSCKNVAIVGETTAMQSGLGLLKFQMQTGAIGHGEYFFLSFANVSTAPSAKGPAKHGDSASVLGHQDASSPSSSPLALETLACDSFYDPGSSTVPFPFPPKREELTSCRCDYCAAACSGGGSIDVDVSNDRPIPVLDGFGFFLVGGVYSAVAACSVTLLWWRRQQDKINHRSF